MADRVVVLYAGQAIERGARRKLCKRGGFAAPLYPGAVEGEARPWV